MRFSIVTPSFRNSNWLKLCVASVHDQGVSLEHIVQDAGSDDGTLEWLRPDRRVRAFVEKDSGMYDAVNRGLRKAGGEILAYLNCDEQYLPGALAAVSDWFERHPDADVLFGDFLVVDEKGRFICYRKVQLPTKYHLMVSHLTTFTCATFFRSRLIQKGGFFFDTSWKAAGDAAWVLGLLEAKVKMGLLGQFASVFVDRGGNLGPVPGAARERRRMFESAPWLARKLSFGLVWVHRVKRLLGGIYHQKPFDYSIYTLESPARRVVHQVSNPTFLWKSRLQSVPSDAVLADDK